MTWFKTKNSFFLTKQLKNPTLIGVFIRENYIHIITIYKLLYIIYTNNSKSLLQKRIFLLPKYQQFYQTLKVQSNGTYCSINTKDA